VRKCVTHNNVCWQTVYDVLYFVFAGQIVNSRLQFRYDLGSDDRILTLPGVNVSDGMRHFVRVSRYGNGAVLRLDAGEGRFYAERWPSDEHRALRLEVASGGGEVTHNFWTNQFHTRAIVDSQLLRHISDLSYFFYIFIITSYEAAKHNMYDKKQWAKKKLKSIHSAMEYKK